MGTHDPRVDTYIRAASDYAKPILNYFREVVHSSVPTVQETMKWSFPHFDYNGMLCSMAAFKSHCAIGFWKGELVFEELPEEREAMGHLGKITSVEDLPPRKELIRLLKKAARLNDEGIKRPMKPRTEKPPVETPDDMLAALKKNKKASTAYEAFSPSHKREYVEWIAEAKSAPTRKKRLDQAVEWIAEGKSRNWKYQT